MTSSQWGVWVTSLNSYTIYVNKVLLFTNSMLEQSLWSLESGFHHLFLYWNAWAKGNRWYKIENTENAKMNKSVPLVFLDWRSSIWIDISKSKLIITMYSFICRWAMDWIIQIRWIVLIVFIVLKVLIVLIVLVVLIVLITNKWINRLRNAFMTTRA